MTYMTLKYWHIISAILLFGTGFGSAFYKWMADRSGNLQHIAMTNRHVVLADWFFTTPAIIAQPITGLWMAHLIQLPLTTPWIAMSIGLYLIAGLCWLPVVYLQIRMQKMSRQAVASNQPLPADYPACARIWFWLGVPAFLAMMAIIYLMVTKPQELWI